jgi:hypothetical protein
MAQENSIPDQTLVPQPLLRRNILEAVDEASADEGDGGLNDAVRGEQEYVRQRLREELKREPTDEEIDEWLREHTESY